MGSMDILLLLLLLVLVVTRARRLGSTFYRVQRPTLHVALGWGKDPAGMRLVTRAQDTHVMLLAGAGAGSMHPPASPPARILYCSAWAKYMRVEPISFAAVFNSSPRVPLPVFPRNSFP
jgi:hypothetical protein